MKSWLVRRIRFALAGLLCGLAMAQAALADERTKFLSRYCSDCHSSEYSEGGLDLDSLGSDLQDESTFSMWVRIFDRVMAGEMPPEDAELPGQEDIASFAAPLKLELARAHAERKGTVLRRLNRREYANTVNDLFGTHLDLEALLPEDGRSHEFDNIGDSLNLSLVHLQRYLEAAKLVLDTCIARTATRPEATTITANYRETREAERFIGKVWKQLDDGAVVRFEGGGYPTGMMRGTSIRKPGRYRVRVRGYAYQAEEPIVFSVGGTSFQRGSAKPIYGYWAFPPGKPGDSNEIVFEAWIEERYMIAIEPYGIRDAERYKRKTIEGYDGPGLAILEVSLEGPLLDEWPSSGHKLLFEGIDRVEVEPRNPRDKQKSWYQPKFQVVTSNAISDANRVIERLATKLFRRPATNAEVSQFLQLFETEYQTSNDFEESLRTVVTAILCSPSFLFLDEPAGELSEHAIASRLSYFLTRSGPDLELLQAAENGRLSDPVNLRSHTERLLNSPDFKRFIIDFTDNWLGLRDLDFTIPDRKLFPEFDDYLRYSMPLETRAFLKELIDQNAPVRSIVHPEFAMLNSRLAEHYEFPPVAGTKIRRVELLDDQIRGGVLSHASVLKVTANGTNTSPVTRGAWVLERIMGISPPPPPPGIPGVEPDIRGASTLRELLAKHRESSDCQACHQKIDPPGFALEDFNPIGGFRSYYRSLGDGERVDREILGRKVNYKQGPEVDSSGTLNGNQSFKNFREFRDQLARNEHMLTTAFVNKLLTFATGRELGFSDREEIEKIVARALSEKHGVRDLFHDVVQSRLFQTK